MRDTTRLHAMEYRKFYLKVQWIILASDRMINPDCRGSSRKFRIKVNTEMVGLVVILSNVY